MLRLHFQVWIYQTFCVVFEFKFECKLILQQGGRLQSWVMNWLRVQTVVSPLPSALLQYRHLRWVWRRREILIIRVQVFLPESVCDILIAWLRSYFMSTCLCTRTPATSPRSPRGGRGSKKPNWENKQDEKLESHCHGHHCHSNQWYLLWRGGEYLTSWSCVTDWCLDKELISTLVGTTMKWLRCNRHKKPL